MVTNTQRYGASNPSSRPQKYRWLEPAKPLGFPFLPAAQGPYREGECGHRDGAPLPCRPWAYPHRNKVHLSETDPKRFTERTANKDKKKIKEQRNQENYPQIEEANRQGGWAELTAALGPVALNSEWQP